MYVYLCESLLWLFWWCLWCFGLFWWDFHCLGTSGIGATLGICWKSKQCVCAHLCVRACTYVCRCLNINVWIIVCKHIICPFVVRFGYVCLFMWICSLVAMIAWKREEIDVLGIGIFIAWDWCNSGHFLEIKTMCLCTFVCACTYVCQCLNINVWINVCKHSISAFVVRFGSEKLRKG